ncbi:MAG TPA: hypothetical protein VMU97_02220 [Candidatus Dormibacteraeota bacterium]|nr:hypothetical protein [Candidatus Dormibacteraeota bacterium]
MNSKTKLYSELKPRAVELRRQGKMYSEICNELGHIPKGTLSNWLKSIELTNRQHERIQKIMAKNGLAGRQIGAQRNHQNRLKRLARIKQTAEDEYKHCLKDPLFLAGLLLYLAEGSKKTERFEFMNSDPKLMKCMVLWTMKNGKQNLESLRFRLYIHELYAHEKCEDFWIKELKVEPEQFLKTVYKPTGRIYKKNPLYKGCLRLEVAGSELYWKTMAWRDCFYAALL